MMSNSERDRGAKEGKVGHKFFGIAAIFAEKTFGETGKEGFWEIKGLDLEAMADSSDFEPETIFNLSIGYCGEQRSFDVIQTFPGATTCVGFTVNRLGKVTSFHDNLPSPEAEGWVLIDARKPFDIRGCLPGEETGFAEAYASKVANALKKCGIREQGKQGPRR